MGLELRFSCQTTIFYLVTRVCSFEKIYVLFKIGYDNDNTANNVILTDSHKQKGDVGLVKRIIYKSCSYN